MLDGALAAADAVGARSITIAVPDDAASTRGALRRAIAERPSARRFEVVAVPVAYLAGEESALIAYLDGGPLQPTVGPAAAVRARPAAAPHARAEPRDARARRADRPPRAGVVPRRSGRRAHPGSALVTVAGAVAPRRASRRSRAARRSQSLLRTAGGALEPLRAVLVGGCHGVWIAADEIDAVTLDDAPWRTTAAASARASIVALGQSACPAQELAHAIG